MHYTISQQLEKLDYPERRRAYETIEALDNGQCYSIDFYADGSGVSFEYHHPTINHGTPGTVLRGFNIQIAMLILAGHRLQSHELSKCM